MFEMGSTIVLVFEAPEGTKFHASEGDRVWLGQELVTIPEVSSKSE
jgi:phosphatidylserine decarboxylase